MSNKKNRNKSAPPPPPPPMRLRSRRGVVLMALALAAVALLFAARERFRKGPEVVRVESDAYAHLRTLPVPGEHQSGEETFNLKCAQCHGSRALGTAVGPPLVHIYYEPNHHADISFYRAIQGGVPAHHWNYGNMPPVPDVSQEQATQVIGYIRWLQREAGIY